MKRLGANTEKGVSGSDADCPTAPACPPVVNPTNLQHDPGETSDVGSDAEPPLAPNFSFPATPRTLEYGLTPSP